MTFLVTNVDVIVAVEAKGKKLHFLVVPQRKDTIQDGFFSGSFQLISLPTSRQQV